MSDFVPMAAIGVGAYLLWFGVHYWRDKGTTYPHTVIKSVVSGGGLPAVSQEPSRAAATKAQLGADVTAAGTDSTTGTGTSSSGGSTGSTGTSGSGSSATPPASSDVYTAMQELATQFGWDAAEVTAWKGVEAAEDGSLSPSAANPQSGALGLGQALGHGTSDTAGTLGNEYGGFGLTTAQAVAANSGNVQDQLLWMANYIKATYGTPTAALAHENEYHWY